MSLISKTFTPDSIFDRDRLSVDCFIAFAKVYVPYRHLPNIAHNVPEADWLPSETSLLRDASYTSIERDAGKREVLLDDNL